MRSTLKSAGVALLLALPLSAQAGIMGLSGDGSYTGSVEGDSNWLTSNAFGGGVDFWTFETTAPTTLSVSLTGDTDFGISLYAGEIGSEFQSLFFDNAGDFSDGSLSFIEGTPAIPLPGSVLTDVLLSSAGVFTIAVGGDNGLFQNGSYNYAMNVTGTMAKVPEPSSLSLLMGAGLAFWASRRARRNG